jgi:hypothetical protein
VHGAVEEICAMTPDEAVALSFAFLSDLRRSGLTDRLLADDPNLVELARSLMPRANAARADAASRGIHVSAGTSRRFRRRCSRCRMSRRIVVSRPARCVERDSRRRRRLARGITDRD